MAGFTIGMDSAYGDLAREDRNSEITKPTSGKEPEETGSAVSDRKEPGRSGRIVFGATEGDKRQRTVTGAEEAEEPKETGFRRKEPGEKCETCENRKYQDGSDENVSFKAAAHISPEAAASRVRAHEGEHVANAYAKAAKKDGEVLSVSVRIETAVCPECGKNYVSGGTTSTKIKYPSNPYEKNQRQLQANAVRGKSIDYAAKPLEEFEVERY